MELLGSEERKSLAQIEALLRAENRIGAGAGAVGFESTFIKDKAEEAVVLLHGYASTMTASPPARQAFAATTRHCRTKDSALY
jgi:hypothetical protein